MWGCFITPFISFFFAVYDHNLLVDRKPQNHLKGWLLMALVSVLPAFFFIREIKTFWFIEYPLVFGMLSLFLWLTFDGIYNKLNGNDFFFTGTGDAKDSSKIDKWLRGKSRKNIILIKTIPLLITIITYIILL